MAGVSAGQGAVSKLWLEFLLPDATRSKAISQPVRQADQGSIGIELLERLSAIRYAEIGSKNTSFS